METGLEPFFPPHPKTTPARSGALLSGNFSAQNPREPCCPQHLTPQQIHGHFSFGSPKPRGLCSLIVCPAREGAARTIKSFLLWEAFRAPLPAGFRSPGVPRSVVGARARLQAEGTRGCPECPSLHKRVKRLELTRGRECRPRFGASVSRSQPRG